MTVLDATGRVKTTLKLMMLWTALTWVLAPVLIFTVGYNGVAIASFLVTLTIVFTIYLLKQVVKFALLKSIYKQSLATIAMGIAVYFSAQVFVHDFSMLIFVILQGGLIYFIIFYLLAKNDIEKDIHIITSRFRREK